MRFFWICTVIFCLIPQIVFAGTPDVPDPYYAHTAPRRAGELAHVLAQARFLATLKQKESDNVVVGSLFSMRELSLLCSLRRSLPSNRGAGFLQTLSVRLVPLFHSARSTDILIALTRHDTCTSERQQIVSQPVRFSLHIQFDSAKRVVSRNPVWNACIRSENLSVDLIRSNTDVFIHRQGRIVQKIPYTCRDYHRGPQNLWLYPDQPGLQIFVDSKARLLGILPSSLDVYSPQDGESIVAR